MYFQSIKEGFLKPFPKQNTHKQRYLSQATNAHDLTHSIATPMAGWRRPGAALSIEKSAQQIVRCALKSVSVEVEVPVDLPQPPLFVAILSHKAS